MDKSVRIEPNHKGELIHVYADFKEFGSVTLVSNEVAREDGFNKLYQQRKYILSDRIESLQELVDTIAEDNIIPGRLVVKEFREKEIPKEYQERLNKKMLYEDSLKPYIKDVVVMGIESYTTSSLFEASKNYPKNQGQRIIRFIDYDRTGEEQDVILRMDKIPLPKFTPITTDNIKSTNFRDTSSLKKSTESNVNQKLNSTSKSVDAEKTQQINAQLKNSEEGKVINNYDVKTKARNTSWFEKLFGTILIPILVVLYIVGVYVQNDKNARMEGTTFLDQLLLIAAFIGAYAVYKAIKNK